MFASVTQLQAQKTHTIGERFGGGIIFDVTPNGQHGLIAKTQDQGMFTWNQARALISDPSNKNNFILPILSTTYSAFLVEIQKAVLS
jgi:hypothetical protein